MKKIKIEVRMESVLCKNCRFEKDFYYLSDFSYGEKLININDGKDYAYVNLLIDETFKELQNIVDNILKENNLSLPKMKFVECIDEIFGIACDDIYNKKIDTSIVDEKCEKCGSIDFEPTINKPVRLVNVELPIITHDKWNMISDSNKKKMIENELKKRKYI